MRERVQHSAQLESTRNRRRHVPSARVSFLMIGPFRRAGGVINHRLRIALTLMILLAGIVSYFTSPKWTARLISLICRLKKKKQKKRTNVARMPRLLYCSGWNSNCMAQTWSTCVCVWFHCSSHIGSYCAKSGNVRSAFLFKETRGQWLDEAHLASLHWVLHIKEPFVSAFTPLHNHRGQGRTAKLL